MGTTIAYVLKRTLGATLPPSPHLEQSTRVRDGSYDTRELSYDQRIAFSSWEQATRQAARDAACDRETVFYAYARPMLFAAKKISATFPTARSTIACFGDSIDVRVIAPSDAGRLHRAMEAVLTQLEYGPKGKVNWSAYEDLRELHQSPDGYMTARALQAFPKAVRMFPELWTRPVVSPIRQLEEAARAAVLENMPLLIR